MDVAGVAVALVVEFLVVDEAEDQVVLAEDIVGEDFVQEKLEADSSVVEEGVVG